MTKKEEKDLRIMKRKIIRIIWGQTKITKEEYRIKTNEKIKQKLEEDIIIQIKQSRIIWLGQVCRAVNGRLLLAILQWDPLRGKKN